MRHRECHLIQMSLMLARHVMVDLQGKSGEHFATHVARHWFIPQEAYQALQKELADKNVLIQQKLT